MSTAVSAIITVVARHLQEDTGFSSGLWSTTEVISYIADADREFITQTGIVKQVNNVPATSGTAVYNEPTDCIDIDRMAWNGQKMYPQTNFELDNQNAFWRKDSGAPKRYHRDQLPPKQFETWPNPNTSGLGYTTTGTYGTLRQVSGSLTYNTTGTYGTLRQLRGASRNYYVGYIAYAGSVQGPYGTLRRVVAGSKNFIVIYNQLPPLVSLTTDLVTTPDSFVRYVAYKVLSKAWAKEGDGQDMERSNYCNLRWKRGLALARRIVYGDLETGGMPRG